MYVFDCVKAKIIIMQEDTVGDCQRTIFRMIAHPPQKNPKNHGIVWQPVVDTDDSMLCGYVEQLFRWLN